MKALKGNGVPTIYWTGVCQKYHVMVMDRLGESLQHILDSRDHHRLSVAELRVTGIKCLQLLRGLHEAGYVHGDVKPENFLVGRRGVPPPPEPRATGAGAGAKGAASRGAPKRRKTRQVKRDGEGDDDEVEADEWSYQESGEAAAAEEPAGDLGLLQHDLEYLINKHDLYMVDLGLGLHWTQKDVGDSTHVAYKQRVDHFSGTVRYASVNVHLGRYSSRRDDLESLAYMLIFMHVGSLPWQGYTGQGKEMMVCRKKGTMSVTDICRSCPEELQYFLAYVRELKYDQVPDYEYLKTCLDFGAGRAAIRKWLVEDAKAPSPAAGAGAGTAPPSVSPVASVSGDPARTAVPKRKRSLTGAESDGAAGATAAAGPSAASGVGSTTSALALTTTSSGARPMVVLPKTAVDQERQWILVSTSQSYHRGMSPLGQTVTMHTCWKNLVNKIKDFWGQQKRICVMSFDNNMWSSVFDDENTGYIQQVRPRSGDTTLCMGCLGLLCCIKTGGRGTREHRGRSVVGD